MKSKKQLGGVSFLLLIFMLFSFIGCNKIQENKNVDSAIESVEGKLIVSYIDVGQADSIFIESDNKSVLIDAGTNETGENVVKFLNEKNIKHIDYVIATHPHEDHIGGMAEVIKNFEIGNFYSPKVISNTKTYERMVKELKNQNLKINILKGGVEPGIDIPGVKVEVLSPNKDEYENLNNYSPIIKITFGKNTFLFTGDAEKEIERELLENNLDLKADVLKVGHHGSSTSTTKDFLNAVNPSYAVISVGKDNKYKHPSKGTIKTLESKKINMLRTDIEGTIVLESDGKNISRRR